LNQRSAHGKLALTSLKSLRGDKVDGACDFLKWRALVDTRLDAARKIKGLPRSWQGRRCFFPPCEYADAAIPIEGLTPNYFQNSRFVGLQVSSSVE
jgi:hypothetical protein